MIKYYQQEMPDLSKTGEKKSYYRLQSTHNISYDELLKHISRGRGSVDEGTIVSSVIQLVETMVQYMTLGHSVTIDGLGTFRCSLGMKDGKKVKEPEEGGPKVTIDSIEVKTVRFKPDKKFVDELNDTIHMESGGYKKLRKIQSTLEERRQLALQFLEENPWISVRDYMQLTHLKRTAATTELRQLAQTADSGIKAYGRGSHRVYIKALLG